MIDVIPNVFLHISQTKRFYPLKRRQKSTVEYDVYMFLEYIKITF